MIKQLDRYILGKFFASFLFILTIIMVIAVVFDFAENSRTMRAIPLSVWEIIVGFYFPFVLYYSHLFANLLLFISVIFFTSKLAANSEIIAILANGISVNRFLRSYLMGAGLISTFLLLSKHLLLPVASQQKFDFTERYIQSTKSFYRNFYKEFDKNSYVSLDFFNFETLTADRFRLQFFDGSYNMIRDVKSRYATYKPADSTWKLQKVLVRSYQDQQETWQEIPTLDTVIHFVPEDIIEIPEIADNLTTPALLPFIEQERERGNSKVLLFELTLHRRTAFPFSTFVLVILGVLFALQKSRNSADLSLNLATGMLLAVSYIFIMQISTVAVTNLKVNPFWAAWYPNIIFSLITLFVYQRKKNG